MPAMRLQNNEPRGDLLLRTVGMPGDTNPNGDIIGGWIMSQMDIAGGMLATALSRGRVVTIAVESMKFIRPVQVGDIVGCHGQLKRAGRTALTLQTGSLGDLTVTDNPIAAVQGNGSGLRLCRH